MKVYITKYALTKGIEVCEAETSDIYSDNIFTKEKYRRYFHKGDWWKNENEAIKKAEEMRVKKITSLEKQIQKLKNLKFDAK